MYSWQTCNKSATYVQRPNVQMYNKCTTAQQQMYSKCTNVQQSKNPYLKIIHTSKCKTTTQMHSITEPRTSNVQRLCCTSWCGTFVLNLLCIYIPLGRPEDKSNMKARSNLQHLSNRCTTNVQRNQMFKCTANKPTTAKSTTRNGTNV